MLNRRVISLHCPLDHGTVIKWEPLQASMCDALVEHDSGKRMWYASSDLRPADELGPLPNRREVTRQADVNAARDLKIILAKFIKEDFNRPWPGCEFAKALVGNAIVGAIEKVEQRI